MLAATRGHDALLVGRGHEQHLLTLLLDEAPTRGQFLLLQGEPGIGKSRLLLEAERTARDRGMTVLKTLGVQCEAHLPLAGLHQLLRPVHKRAADLGDVQRAALDAAFGRTPDAAPALFKIAMAVLDLLSEIATEAPLLLIVEDAHWLDRPTSEVLAFVARRIESDPIVILAATRDGYSSPLAESGLPEHIVTGLDETSAAALIDEMAPALPAVVRTSVLREAGGNPLAILELPAAVDSDDTWWPTGGVPLTSRLERAFADRVSTLPDETQLVLLVAALSDGERLDEILDASALVAGAAVALDVVGRAADAGIVYADLQTIHFRHPLVRSAVAQSAGVAERRRVHEALAEVLHDQPDRRVWQRAALLSGEHEGVACELQEAGARARQQGAGAIAVTALRRAAELGQPGLRSRRMLAAAELAVEVGRPDVVAPLLREVNLGDLSELDRARMTWVEETALTRPLDAARYETLIEAATQAGAAGDHDLHVNLLWLVASRSWWVDPDPEVRQALIRASDRLGDADNPDPRVVAIHAYADPWRHAPAVLTRLDHEASASRTNPDAARFFGPAALVVGAFDLGADFLAAAVDGLRRDGRLGHLPRLLMLYACTAARIGQLNVASAAADEGRRLAEEFADPQMSAAADTASALVAAVRGDDDTAERLAAHAELVAEPAGANITMAFAQFARVLAALGAGRHNDAYASAERLFDPGDSAYHPVISSWLIADLAEAALHIGQVDAAHARVDQVARDTGNQTGAWVAIGLRHARALLADQAAAGACFEEALAIDLTRWPFQRARIQLSYGQWLRRHGRVTDSRGVLRAARDTFDAVGSLPWGDRARRELRASGERSRRRVPEAHEQLTTQELQIAQLAADGLSNREIGQQLFLSHRTISTHLYRVFPKLGITSRAELSAALAPAVAAGGD